MPQSISSSIRLIEQAKLRDATAWERMAQMYGPLVYTWARQSGLQDTDAADLVQDVFRSVFLAIDRFDHTRSNAQFRNWLFGITRNRLLDFFRQRQAQPVGTGGTTAHLGFEQLIDQAAERSATSSVRSLALRALAVIETDFEPATWQAFWRVAIEGDSPQVVANELTMTVAAVYKARSRILKRLRLELGDGVSESPHPR